MQKDEFLLLELLARPVAFHPILARAAGSAAAGLFLSQLFYWAEKGSHNDGWIYKDWQEWQSETCLTQDEQRGARKLLQKQNIIEVSSMRALGIDKFKGTLCFKINFETLKKCILDQNTRETRATTDDGKIPLRSAENPAPESRKSRAGEPKIPLLTTESTAETSSEKTNNNPPGQKEDVLAEFADGSSCGCRADWLADLLDEVSRAAAAGKIKGTHAEYAQGMLKNWRKAGRPSSRRGVKAAREKAAAEHEAAHAAAEKAKQDALLTAGACPPPASDLGKRLRDAATARQQAAQLTAN